MAAAHVNFLKAMVELDISEVEELLAVSDPNNRRSSFRRKSSFGIRTTVNADGTVTHISRETINNPATGKMIEVRKIFANTDANLPYREVGWIHRADIPRCMICNAKFGVLSGKHNCVCCGMVVCHACGNRAAMVDQLQSPELSEEENKMKHRVCKRCHRGAGRVSAAVTKFDQVTIAPATLSDHTPSSVVRNSTPSPTNAATDAIPTSSPRATASKEESVADISKQAPVKESPRPSSAKVLTVDADGDYETLETERLVTPQIAVTSKQSTPRANENAAVAHTAPPDTPNEDGLQNTEVSHDIIAQDANVVPILAPAEKGEDDARSSGVSDDIIAHDADVLVAATLKEAVREVVEEETADQTTLVTSNERDSELKDKATDTLATIPEAGEAPEEAMIPALVPAPTVPGAEVDTSPAQAEIAQAQVEVPTQSTASLLTPVSSNVRLSSPKVSLESAVVSTVNAPEETAERVSTPVIKECVAFDSKEKTDQTAVVEPHRSSTGKSVNFESRSEAEPHETSSISSEIKPATKGKGKESKVFTFQAPNQPPRTTDYIHKPKRIVGGESPSSPIGKVLAAKPPVAVFSVEVVNNDELRYVAKDGNTVKAVDFEETDVPSLSQNGAQAFVCSVDMCIIS